jgi:hypothetical protein
MAENRVAANALAYRLTLTFTAFVLLWFAIWTVTVNGFVMVGSYFNVLPWCLLGTTALAIPLAAFSFPRLLSHYEFGEMVAASTMHRAAPKIACLLAIAALGAIVAHLTRSWVVTFVAATSVTVFAYLIARRSIVVREEPDDQFALSLLLIWIVILSLYFFGHRPDWDDSALLNFAAKAPQTHGQIFALDTMVGDGPHPIFLPTYKFHAYDLLVATLSSLSGLEPIQVAHLALPVVTLSLLASTMALVLRGAVGAQWVTAALFSLGLLYANMVTLQSWGMNGLARFHQNHGALVLIIPLLAAGLTVHWFLKRHWADLVALTVLQICAIGVSANGIYLGPLASGFVAVAYFLSNPRQNWSAAWRLLPTLIYPVVVAALIIVRHLALPSEQMTAGDSFSALRNVVGWRAEGLAFLALLPLAPLIANDERSRAAAAFYFPVTLLLVLNPVGWHVVSGVTGNLGFRIFWAVPGVFVAGAACARILESLGLVSKLIGPALGLSALCIGIAYNQRAAGPDTRVQWHRPDLRVPQEDYKIAKVLASLTPAGCKALVPAKYAVWMTGLKRAPYLVSVSSLYLTEYRFTEPQDELAARWALFNLVNGNSVTGEMPSPDQIRKYGMNVGLMAMDRSNRNFALGEQFAQELRLVPASGQPEGLEVWRRPPC